MNDETNGLLPAVQEPKPPAVKEEQQPFDFMPRSLAEAMELARMLAESTMVPRDYLGKAGNCFIAMQHGAELGLKPVQALQSIAVINGKPGIFGDAGKGLLLKHGCIIQELDVREIEVRGYAQCTVSRPGRPSVTRTFSKDDAVRASLWGKSGPWTQYPYRQMAWRAFWFAARDAAADILKGLPPAEELRDMAEIDITPQSETLPREEPKAPVSATSKLKERLKPGAASAEVIKLFETATTLEQLGTAVDRAAELVDAPSPDKAKMNAAYHAAKARILPPAPKTEPQPTLTPEERNRRLDAMEQPEVKAKNASGAPEPLTDEQIMAGLKAAQTRDEIDLYCSIHVSPLEESPRKGLLLTHYNKIRSEFPE